MAATVRIIGNGTPAPLADGACSSYLVRQGETQLLLDCGPGSLPKLRRYTSVGDLDCIILSHMHTDHFLDLLAMNVALRSAEHGRGGPVERRVQLLLPPGGLVTIEACFDALSRGVPGTLASRWRESFDAREYDPGETLTLGELTVSWAGPTKHSALCYGVRIEHEGRTFGYTGDTAYCDAAVDVGRNASLFLSECTLLEPGPSSGTHIAAAELGRVARAAKCERLLVTHVPRQDDEYRKVLRELIESEFSGPVDIVNIGDEFEL